MLAHFLGLTLIVSSCFATDVLVFTDKDFAEKVSEHPIILVEFYAPWCGHCKRLAPEYEIAATRLKASDPPVHIAKVDCTAETKTCEKYGVSGYPTLKVFKAGSMAFDYEGGRDADGIVKYMLSKAGPTSREISTEAELEKFLSSAAPVIVGFFDELGSVAHKAFEGAAGALSEDFRFAHTFSKDLASKLGHSNNVVIYQPKVLHSKFEDKLKKFEGALNMQNLKSWIEKNIMGLAGIRSASNSKYFSERPLINVYYDADYERNPKGTNYYRNRLMKVAQDVMKKTGKKFTLAINNVKQSHELNEYGIDIPDNKKVYVCARDQNDAKYKMSDEFSVESFTKWLTSFLDGKEEAHLKSEPVPTSQDAPVKVVVAKNFDEIVNDPTKDVLIEFYAPWCGHCKSLAPKYDELAEKLKNEKNIVIAKMDATANDVPPTYKVQGFPTLYFSPKNEKESPKQYNGGREVNDFIKYLAESATEPLSGYDRSGNPRKSEL
jgi:protein disulfide-isomerase A3